jgi:hypothetical protein
MAFPRNQRIKEMAPMHTKIKCVVFMCRRCTGMNVLQRAPHVAYCVTKYDTCDTFYFSVIQKIFRKININCGIKFIDV